MAVNSKQSLTVRGSKRPQEGEEVWALPVKIDYKGQASFKNPFSYGSDYICVPNITDLPTTEYSTGEIGFPNKDEPLLLKITYVKNGQIKAESTTFDEKEEADSTIDRPNRDEPIEWNGTEQKSGSTGSEERTAILSEDDIRGNKNDLL